MILIFSQEDDSTTHMVLDWLCYWKNKYTVLCPTIKVIDIYFHPCSDRGLEFVVEHENGKFGLAEVSTFWYRRGYLNPNLISIPPFYEEKKYSAEIKKHLNAEFNSVGDAFFNLLESKKSLGSYSANKKTNKINNLIYAFKAGFKIPKSYILSDKEKLKLASISNTMISKSINRDFKFNGPNELFNNFGPMEVAPENIDIMNEKFFPSFFQEKIKKQFELRIFILKEKIFSMAVFSQMDSKTQLDSRRPTEDHLRMVPFSLPPDISEKLMNFMMISNQNCASIDMIFDDEGEYVFLESNPVGQFGYISVNCNYFLDYEIASYLAEHE